MLKGIDPRVTPDLMDVLMRMGHGDELLVVDSNYPAFSMPTRTGRVVDLAGLDVVPVRFAQPLYQPWPGQTP